MQWTLVIPLKPLERAKSRLSDTAGDGLRPGLALAFAQDTVAAALASPRSAMWQSSRTIPWPPVSWPLWAPESSPTSHKAA